MKGKLKWLNTKNIISLVIVFSIISASVFSGFFNNELAVSAQAPLWNGTVASAYASGCGTEADPYIIETAEQLALAVTSGGVILGTSIPAFVKIADSVDKIYLSDIEGMNYAEAMTYLETHYDILWNNGATSFVGNFDGNGCTVYGMRQGGWPTGFFGGLSGGAVVKNLNIKYAYLRGGGAVMAANTFAGDGSPIVISNCAIIENSIDSAGGYIFSANGQTVDISNCLFVNGYSQNATLSAFIGNTYTQSKITNSLSVGAVPVSTAAANSGDPWFYSMTNVYTDTPGGASALAQTIVANSVIKGEAAKTTLAGFDFYINWKITDGYPTPQVPTSFNGIKGEVWSGNIAEEYSGGDGSEENPYIIETAEQLALAVTSSGRVVGSNKAAYFKIADDVDELYLNNIKGMDYTSAKSYLSKGGLLWNNKGEGFVGTLDGNGCVIYGMKQTEFGTGLFSALVQGAVIKNLIIKHSYLIGGGAIISDHILWASNNLKAKIFNCAVIDNYISGGEYLAGFVRNVGGSYEISNSIYVGGEYYVNGKTGNDDTRFGAFVCDSFVAGNVYNCISIGARPVNVNAANATDNYFYGFDNIYTDMSGGALTDLCKIIDRSAIKGSKAQNVLNGFDFDVYWSITDSYPMPRNVRPVNYSDSSLVLWDGTAAKKYAGGEGTQENPYIIKTAEQLYKAVNEHGMSIDGSKPAFFKIADGIKELHLNLVKELKFDEVKTYLDSGSDKIKSWKPQYGVFRGELDGNGCTIFGLYTRGENCSGLVPIIGDGAIIKNITVTKSLVAGNTFAGGIVGSFQQGSPIEPVQYAEIRSCAVTDSKIEGTYAGGIMGSAQQHLISIRDCLYVGGEIYASQQKGGIISGGWHNWNIDKKTGSVTNCLSVGEFPVRDDNGISNHITVSVTYTDIASAGSVNGVTTIKDQILLKGNNAKDNLKFNFKFNWEITNYYPVPKNIRPVTGTPGEVWSGQTADYFSVGDGTEKNPYQIDTPERLHRMLLYPETGACYVLTADIYLNDVSSKEWYLNSNLNAWVSRDTAFKGKLDGQGHVVYGLYHYYKDYVGAFFAALVPVVGEGAVIERVGVSKAYIDQPIDAESDSYAASIVGFVSNYAGAVNNSTNVQLVEELTAKGKKVPIISECFGDNTVYLKSKYAGGIVCGTDNPVIIKNCYFTGSLKAESERNGMMIGNTWIYGNHIENCFASSQTDDWFIAGVRGTVQSYKDYISTNVVGSYYFTTKFTYGPVKIEKLSQRTGEGAKEFMKESLDFDKIWQAVDNGTPVLRAFNTKSHNASEFSDKTFVPPNVTISFVTGDKSIKVDNLTGGMLSALTLPIPTRKGYDFKGWYIYSEYQCEYIYDYFPLHDMTLYAKWEINAIIQDFENYPSTEFDVGEAYRYNRPGKVGYKKNYAYGGNKSMQRLDGVSGMQDCLLNYDQPLEIGREYEMTFWMCTDKDGTNADVYFVNNTWPDISEPIKGDAMKAVSVKGLKKDNWQQYTFKFSAQTQWISLRTENSSLYFDDFMLFDIGKGVEIKDSDSVDVVQQSDNYVKVVIVIGAAVAVVAVLVAVYIIIKKRKSLSK